MKVLKTEISMPFLSELYRWITGSALTLLDLVCLALAVPVHIAHIAVTTLMGSTRTFADDNSGLVARLEARENGRPPLRTSRKLASSEPVRPPRPLPMDTTAETLIIVLRGINLAAGLVSDAMFTRTVSNGGIASASPTDAAMRGFAKVVKGATGIAASYVQTYESLPRFEQRMQTGVTPEVWSSLKPQDWMTKSVFAILVLGDSITFLGGAKQVFSPPAAQQLNDLAPELGIDGGSIDKAEYRAACLAVVGMSILIWRRVVIYQENMDTLEAAWANEYLTKMVKMYFIRDICMIVARMPWFMFTQAGANKMRSVFGGGASVFYGIITALRAAGGATALATHIIAAYDYGQKA